jgi:hypothetical protein
MKFLLKLKNWQLFIIMFGALLCLKVYEYFDTTPHTMLKLTLYLIFGLIYFSWIWAIVTNFYSKVVTPNTLNPLRFKLLFFLTIVLIILSGIASSYIDEDILGSKLFYLLFFLYMATLLTYMLTIRFAAKTIQSIEMGKMAKLDDYATVYFMIVFSFVGVGLLQPRINRLAKS